MKIEKGACRGLANIWQIFVAGKQKRSSQSI